VFRRTPRRALSRTSAEPRASSGIAGGDVARDAATAGAVNEPWLTVGTVDHPVVEVAAQRDEAIAAGAAVQ
jgi:hypothetical protein